MKANYAWAVAYGQRPMSNSLAKKIHSLRCINGYSWRAVASAITDCRDSNQLLGMDLCKIAKQKYPDGDW